MRNIFFLLLFLNITPAILAQPKIVFDKLVHDFGEVNEGDGSVAYDFIFRNTGTVPLIIQDVKTTCGCTTPEWTKSPIKPNSTGSIKVSYDAKGRPGIIDKTITVIHNSGAPIALKITGMVKALDRHPTLDFRHSAGQLRLSDMHINFSRIYSYEKAALTIEAYNPTDKPVTVSFVDLPNYIKVSLSSKTVQPKNKMQITVSYDAANHKYFGFVSEQLSFIQNNNADKKYKLTLTANVEEDFSRWSAQQIANAPKLFISSSALDAGELPAGKTSKLSLTIKNTGKSPLSIHNIEANSPLLSFDYPRTIPASQEATISIFFDTKNLSGAQSKSFTIISNDPKNAKSTIRIKANITK